MLFEDGKYKRKELLNMHTLISLLKYKRKSKKEKHYDY